MKSHRILVAALAIGCLGASTALAGTVVGRSFGMASNFRMTTAPADGCSNNPGPYITLDGEISLGSLSAVLRFSNNLKGTHVHEEDVVTEVHLLSGEPIHFNKQPSRGGVGGNPYVWLILHHGDGSLIGTPGLPPGGAYNQKSDTSIEERDCEKHPQSNNGPR